MSLFSSKTNYIANNFSKILNFFLANEVQIVTNPHQANLIFFHQASENASDLPFDHRLLYNYL